MCHQGPYPEDEARTRALPWLPEGPALATRGPCPGYPRVEPCSPEGKALAFQGSRNYSNRTFSYVIPA